MYLNAKRKELSLKEFERAVKRDKVIGYDDVICYAIVDVYDSIKVVILHIFKTYLEEAVFPQTPEISKVIAVFKRSEKNNVEDYRLISTLPVFSRVLKRIICIIRCMNLVFKNITQS